MMQYAFRSLEFAFGIIVMVAIVSFVLHAGSAAGSMLLNYLATFF
jgi:hypothetical protein